MTPTLAWRVLSPFLGHINNLYNTTFWALVQIGGLDPKAATEALSVCGVLRYCAEPSPDANRP